MARHQPSRVDQPRNLRLPWPTALSPGTGSSPWKLNFHPLVCDNPTFPQPSDFSTSRAGGLLPLSFASCSHTKGGDFPAPRSDRRLSSLLMYSFLREACSGHWWLHPEKFCPAGWQLPFHSEQSPYSIWAGRSGKFRIMGHRCVRAEATCDPWLSFPPRLLSPVHVASRNNDLRLKFVGKVGDAPYSDAAVVAGWHRSHWPVMC